MKLEDSQFTKRVLNHIRSHICVTDVETDEILYMNDSMKQDFHLDDAKGRKCYRVLQTGKSSRCEFCKIDRLLRDGEKMCVWTEHNPVTGRIYLTQDSIEEWDGRTYHIQNAYDITDQVRVSEEASIDELTGVLNRLAGKRKLKDLIHSGKTNFTVVLYDINGLKWVNDTYGHLEGDRLLVFVTHNIQKELQDEGFVFRLSGDEFIVVFYRKNVKETELWMDRLLTLLEERRAANQMHYTVSFSYGVTAVHAGEHLSVSDVLALADTQMYIQKRDYHIMMGKKRLREDQFRKEDQPAFSYNKDYLFDAVSESIDDYLFVGNLKTGEFMYSRKMVMDFDLPGQVLSNAAAFWGERIHPEDAEDFLRSNQEIADGRADRHTVTYRAKDINGKWVNLLCRGKMIRDEEGKPDIFAGVIRNLDREPLE